MNKCYLLFVAFHAKRNGVIALRANKVLDILSKFGDIKTVTIGEALTLKNALGLTDSEAIAIFLGGSNDENL